MNKLATALCAAVCATLGGFAALGAPCPGNPDALGTSRTIVVDPTEHNRIGTMQYSVSLPLAEKEVVLTFDDGPLPPYTDRILETLARECVQATFFVVGRMARAYPDAARRVYNAGHTIGTHSENHPFNFSRLPAHRIQQEISSGIASTAAALGSPRALAPFFRIPGLGRSRENEAVLASQHLMVWSADFPADDWRHIGAAAVANRALSRLEAKGRGVLLLHDIQPATVLALPHLLRQLKARGYRVVHVVPAGPDRPKTLTTPDQWAAIKRRDPWPRVMPHVAVAGLALPAPSRDSFGWPNPFRPRISRSEAGVAWPEITDVPVRVSAPGLPVPSWRSFGVPHPFGPKVSIGTLPTEEPESTVHDDRGMPNSAGQHARNSTEGVSLSTEMP